MADRERLAALLYEVGAYRELDGDVDRLRSADCLIDAGVGFPDARLREAAEEVIAAERARITSALRSQPTPPRLFALSAWDLAAVLAIVSGEEPTRG